MAFSTYSDHFGYFFRRLNPSSTFRQVASSEYNSVKALIEDRSGPASILSPVCFLQGSYDRQTAIYTINDVDIVALCQLWHPGQGDASRSWSRDDIFTVIAAPLLKDQRYNDKIRFTAASMCIKVDLNIKLEILPVVFKSENTDPSVEPFRLYRPESGHWEDGFARYHQGYLTLKNSDDRTTGSFIPAIKVLKHLRSRFGLNIASFHLECLLYSLPDALFRGGPADYIPAILNQIATTPAANWYGLQIMTPCGDRDIFVSTEWGISSWQAFHQLVSQLNPLAQSASQTQDWDQGINLWQSILGDDYFPTNVTT